MYKPYRLDETCLVFQRVHKHIWAKSHYHAHVSQIESFKGKTSHADHSQLFCTPGTQKSLGITPVALGC